MLRHTAVHRFAANLRNFWTRVSDMEPIVIKPTATHTATVIFMHGLGDTGHGWADAIPQLNPRIPHTKFILPTAPTRPITINHGMAMPGWYDITGLSADAGYDEAGLEESRKTINSLIEAEIAAGIPSTRIVLAGFSQGGAMSLYTGLQYPQKLGGIVVMSGYLPAPTKVLSSLSPANKATDVLVCHGDADQVVILPWGLGSSELLKQAGIPVTFKLYKRMGHSACPAEIRDVAEFLLTHLP